VFNNNFLRKVDLHIHTPASTCYGDKSVIPEKIVEAAIEVGLEAIAITDHNTCDGIDSIRRIGAENGLIVFPGVEISTKEGHFIAIFEVGTPLSKLKAFLDEVGILKEAAGDGHAMVNDDIESILKEIQNEGGINIAAHIDRWPSGFVETKQSRKVKEAVHASNYLNALEITIPQNKALWNDGLVRGYPKKYACIQSSDAHSIEEIGRRAVYIEMERIGIAALRDAFLDHQRKIIFPDEIGRA
jgi:predicted metal-dependent phosphoesterase TrpH